MSQRPTVHSAALTSVHCRVDAAAAVRALYGRVPALALIGNTPMVRVLAFDESHPGVELYAKVESFNPGGSIKDRPVVRMLASAIAAKRLRPGQTILDASCGNAGIAYAMIGGALGHPVEIVIPDSASGERIARMRAHGAIITHTSARDGQDETIRAARAIAASDPERYFYCDQYSNRDNPRAHYETTAEEIWQQTGGRITHFVCGVGTGGVLTGCGRRLKELKREVQIEMLVPEAFAGIEGLEPLGDPHDHVPEILDLSVADRRWDVDVDEAWEVSQILARAGLFCGQSAGANVLVAREVARGLARRRKRGVVVTILPDIGERYFSTRLWDV